MIVRVVVGVEFDQVGGRVVVGVEFDQVGVRVLVWVEFAQMGVRVLGGECCDLIIYICTRFVFLRVVGLQNFPSSLKT